MLRYRTTIAVVIVVAVIAGCSSNIDKSGGVITVPPLTLHGIDPSDGQEIVPFIDQVLAISGGSVQFTVTSNWHVGATTAEQDALQAVKDGAADYAVVPVRAFRGVGVPSFDALIAPMAIDTLALQEQALLDPAIQDMLDEVGDFGLVGLGLVPGPLRQPGGISRALLAPSDFASTTIGIGSGEVADRSVRALGATPLPPVFNGTDISPLDGVEIQLDSIAGNRYDGVIKTITSNVTLWPRPYVVVGNAMAVAALTADQLDLLKTAARRAVSVSTDELQQTESDVLGFLCQRALMTFRRADDGQLAELRRAFQPVYEWLEVDHKTAKFLDRIAQLRGRESAAADLSCSATDSSTMSDHVADGRWTPIDGVYQMEATVADGVEFGLPDDGNPTSSGSYTRSFDRGTFSETQSNDVASTWANGTYTVDGDVLTILIGDGGGSASARGSWLKEGEVQTWNWSRYHDQLIITWTDPNASDYPGNYAVKPWTRVGDAS